MLHAGIVEIFLQAYQDPLNRCPPKKVNKVVIKGIKSLVDKSNNEIAKQQVGSSKKPSKNGNFSPKKRLHENVNSLSFNPGSLSKEKGKGIAQEERGLPQTIKGQGHKQGSGGPQNDNSKGSFGGGT